METTEQTHRSVTQKVETTPMGMKDNSRDPFGVAPEHWNTPWKRNDDGVRENKRSREAFNAGEDRSGRDSARRGDSGGGDNTSRVIAEGKNGEFYMEAFPDPTRNGGVAMFSETHRKLVNNGNDKNNCTITAMERKQVQTNASKRPTLLEAFGDLTNDGRNPGTGNKIVEEAAMACQVVHDIQLVRVTDRMTKHQQLQRQCGEVRDILHRKYNFIGNCRCSVWMELQTQKRSELGTIDDNKQCQ